MADPVLIHAANARKAGQRRQVNPAHILAILSVEGGTSASGAPVAPGDGLGPPSYGQFITSTGRALGVVYGNSASETDAIARYLNQLGYQADPRRAIAAYNGGPGNPQYGYAGKVLAAAKRYVGLTLPSGTASAPGAGADTTGDTETPAGGAGKTALRVLLTVGLIGTGAALISLGFTRSVTRPAFHKVAGEIT